MSPRGGLWLSVILRPKLDPAKLGIIQVYAAVAARNAVETTTGARIRVKWPNDLILAEQKLGGILVESKLVGGTVSFVVVGIGLNVNQHARALPEGAVSLSAMAGVGYDLGVLLEKVLKALESKYHLLDQPPLLVAEWWRHCVHRSKKVKVSGPSGVLIGWAEGLTQEGRLILETSPGKSVEIEEGTLETVPD